MMLSMNGLAVGKYVPTSTIKTESLSAKYLIEGQIGRGKFAVVKKCKEHKTGEVVAAKFIKKRRRGKSCREEILREVVMLELAMAHPRLVDLREVYETPQEIILITEYCSGGELFHECIIEESFSEQDVVRFIIQILEGLDYLHKQSIVHLDLKPQNILLTKPFPEGDVKICDLGFASLVSAGDELRDIIGTADYIAPEVLDYDPLGVQTDMWSLGVLTYVMLTAHSPFAGDTQQETFSNISQVKLDFPEELFSDISQSAQDFMTRLLVKDPRKRMTAAQSLQHPWLSGGILDNKIPPALSSPAQSSDLPSPTSPCSSPTAMDNCTSPGSVAMDTSKGGDLAPEEGVEESIPTSPLDVSMSSPLPPTPAPEAKQEEENSSPAEKEGERRLSINVEESPAPSDAVVLRTPPPDFEKMAQNYRASATSWNGGASSAERSLQGKDVDQDRASKRHSMEVPLKRPKVSESELGWETSVQVSSATEAGYDLTLGAERSYDSLNSPQGDGWRFDSAPSAPTIFATTPLICSFSATSEQDGVAVETRNEQGDGQNMEKCPSGPERVQERVQAAD